MSTLAGESLGILIGELGVLGIGEGIYDTLSPTSTQHDEIPLYSTICCSLPAMTPNESITFWKLIFGALSKQFVGLKTISANIQSQPESN